MNAVPHIDRAAETQTLLGLLAELQAEFAANTALPARMGYVEMHFSEVLHHRRMVGVDMITPHIHGRVLEWGCHHAVDSCIHRMRHGDGVELYGCDIVPDDTYKPFHRFARLHYTCLTHPWELDYPDAFFDVVTSGGVLEHVPDDARSVGEIFRILKPGGEFVITFLPNRYSYTEALQRRFGNATHDRLYSIGSARKMLEAVGFRLTVARPYLMMPTVLNGFPARVRTAYERCNRPVWALNAVLERLWPLNLLSSNLMLVARKPE
ncbi:MAG TPA: methyltransferase domain-containing protein [Armatimonadota bacterium]